jgi:branched-chain amino acid transport system substrate-binding protein
MRNLLHGILLITVSFFVLTGCEKKKTAETIDFGIQGPETGEIAVYGLQTLYGAQLAAKEINAEGGINGKPLRIIHYDSRGDKQEAVNVAQRLINIDKVCAVLGEPTSGATFAVRNILNESKTVEISAGATAKDVTTGLPFIFRNTLLDDDGAPATIDFLMKTKGWKNYVIITSVNNDYSVGLSETFRKAITDLGGTVVAEQSINDKDTNISAQVTAIKSRTFDAVVYSGYYQEASLILLELRKQGIPAPLVGGDGLQSPELYNVAKDAAIGTVFFAGFSTFSPEAKIVAFNEKITAENADSEMFAAPGYDAFYMLANAARDAGVTDCSDAAQRSKMRDALATVKNFPGVSGEMSFDTEGNAIKKPFIQEVYKSEDGNYRLRLLN